MLQGGFALIKNTLRQWQNKFNPIILLIHRTNVLFRVESTLVQLQIIAFNNIVSWHLYNTPFTKTLGTLKTKLTEINSKRYRNCRVKRCLV